MVDFLSDEYVEKVEEVKQICEQLTLKDIAERIQEKEYKLLQLISKSKKHQQEVLMDKKFASKNRYQTVPCYKHNLVFLDSTKKIGVDNFIHANFIPDLVKNTEKCLIATQGPLENTAEDFWKMVEQQQTSVIIAIIGVDEIPKKCFKYFPDNEISFGKYKIKKILNKTTNLYYYRKLLM